MSAPVTRSANLIAFAIVVSLAGCGGGGDSPATTAGPTQPTTTTGTTSSGQTLVASTGTTNSPANNQQGVIGNASPLVPNANLVLTALPAASYTDQAALAWNSIQDWRNRLRSVDGGSFGVGFLTRSASLDAVARTLATTRSARASAATLLAPAGYPVAVFATASTGGSLIEAGAFCGKSLFSSLPGVELLTSGMRDVGIYSPATNGDDCAIVAGLTSLDSWQLPPTGSTSVYPFPGKQLTLPNYYGDPTLVGFPAGTALGHIVFVSVASVDALPASIPGAGTGSVIPASRITVQEFTLRNKASGSVVPAKVLVPAGVVLAAGVTAETSSQFFFPTSMVLVPSSPLASNTVFAASFRATVNGRSVFRNWEFTTADSPLASNTVFAASSGATVNGRSVFRNWESTTAN